MFDGVQRWSRPFDEMKKSNATTIRETTWPQHRAQSTHTHTPCWSIATGSQASCSDSRDPISLMDVLFGIYVGCTRQNSIHIWSSASALNARRMESLKLVLLFIVSWIDATVRPINRQWQIYNLMSLSSERLFIYFYGCLYCNDDDNAKQKGKM